MIKCDGFGKLLKPLFSILSIGFFGFFANSFVNAGTLQTVGINGNPSIYDNSYDLTFLKGGGLLSLFLGQGKSILALNSSAFFWWAPNGQPYYYDKGLQGFFSNYYVCDNFTGGITTPTNCVSYPMSNFSDSFKSFFKQVNQGDLAYYNYEGSDPGGYYYDNTIEVCFGSNSINKSICFRQHECYNGRGCSAGNYGGLVNSQGFQNLTFGMISDSLIGYAPGQVGYNGEYYGETNGSLNVDFNSVITGDYTYSTCTVGQVIDELESNGYTSYVCYGGLDNFDDWDSSQIYNIIPGSGLRLSQILSYSSVWSTPQDWFDYWAGLYGDDKFNAMWESYPAVYHTWFDLYYRYTPNKYFDSVREYCNMKVDLNLDLNSVYNGQYFKGVCDTIIDKQIYNYGNTTSGGEVLQGVNWGFNSGQSINNSIEFIQNYFNLIKSKINLDYSPLNVGFLPKYIIGFLLALILFRFISH